MRPFAFLPCLVALAAPLAAAPAAGGDLAWEVENPFRLFRKPAAFALHERAFAAAKGAGKLPADIVWRTERRLNEPDCADPATPASCEATARARYDASRLGWAAQVVDDTCYDANVRPRRYGQSCERQYSWGSATESYVLPEAHTVQVRLSPARLAEAVSAEANSAGVKGGCTWTWQPRRAGGKVETRRQPCKAPLVVERVPYSRNAADSGVAVSVLLPNGQVLSDPAVVVEDLLIVALGDSFASGEANPDRPVVFGARREMVYDPTLLRDDIAALKKNLAPVEAFGLAVPGGDVDPKALPRRKLPDDDSSVAFKPASPEFATAFERGGARWLSPDCHRSLYGYPMRVGLQLALENRQRSVTLVSLACAGAEVADGLFLPSDAREGFKEPGGAKVPPQLDLLADLMCEGPRASRLTYRLPTYPRGSSEIGVEPVTMRWCPRTAMRRPIDLVLLSIGGDDVGLSSLALYAVTDSAADVAPIAVWVGHELRVPPSVANANLEVLDERLQAVRSALEDGFGVPPGRVLQTQYPPLQYDETGQLCGSPPTLGLDVAPQLAFSPERLREVSGFHARLLQRMTCIASSKGADCPTNLATGAGTGFRLIGDHVGAFARRGLCAREPQRAQLDQTMMAVPRRSLATGEFVPYSPAATLPYGRHWRLFRTPNDAFLTANTHRDNISPFDVLQPAYAALYGGAFHPTAEGHAVMADHVVRHARTVLEERQNEPAGTR
ncbi:hypothetical protein [Blastochloris viridis]|uniref:Uncharacterized protein n=1 Tax=Blastochloris viridis TaxID=1079 RepID=A0A0H5BCH4_BLAVI|nr:hypothetical protein [Blastochloris viridis]ALK10174.1 hypothetical protein BVIR_2407 [Blastochloris viridis]BAR99895.1 hypothetical protein BV133_2302 [Blastochloris viridis]CUU42838.1 hypothetical protein BVIRIDIS_18530 [Blastochloris viridis]